MHKVRLPDGSEFGPAPMEVLVRWASEGRVPPDAVIVDEDGSKRPVSDVGELAPLVLAPPTIPTGVARPVPGAMSGMIPTGNPAALIGYYLAIFSLIPPLGLLLGPAGAVSGLFGLRAVKRDATRRGTVHAWVGIVLGMVTGFGSWTLLVFLVASAQ